MAIGTETRVRIAIATGTMLLCGANYACVLDLISAGQKPLQELKNNYGWSYIASYF